MILQTLYIMNKIIFKSALLTLLTAIAVFPGTAFSQQQASTMDIFDGHFSSVGNTDSPTRATNNNIYIKLFEGQWIATLYIPYPYASTVEPATITKVLEQAKKKTTTSSYLRGKFGELDKLATVHVEKFGYLEDRIVYECGSLAPCTIKLGDGYLELIKPGVINEHIIRYDHVVTQ